MTDTDDMAKMMQGANKMAEGGLSVTDLDNLRPTDSDAGEASVVNVRSEDDEDIEAGAISHYPVNPSLDGSLNEHQMMMVTGEIPVDKILVRPVGKKKGSPAQSYSAYLPIEFVKDALNKITGWAWEVEIIDWEEDDNSLDCTGKLIIYGKDRTIRIPCYGGVKKKDNKNLTRADLRKTAQSDLIKDGARTFGIGLGLRDPLLLEQVMVYRGKAREPPKKEVGELQGLLKQMNLSADEVGINSWEWKSDERVLHWQKELRSRT